MANGGQALADRLTERISILLPANLQPMVVLEDIDTEQILADRMARLKALWASYDPPSAAQYDVEELEFDPIKINQEASTYFELLLRDRVNQAARSVTLAYAIGTDLDAIASRYPGGVPRLEGESDDHYRAASGSRPTRCRPHGTAEAYEFWALTASPALRDVTAIRSVQHDYYPTILITCLMGLDSEDPKPSQEQLVIIRSYIQSLSRQGLTDVFRSIRRRCWRSPTISMFNSIRIARSGDRQAQGQPAEADRRPVLARPRPQPHRNSCSLLTVRCSPHHHRRACRGRDDRP